MGQLASGYLQVLTVRSVAGCAIVSSLSFGLLQAQVIGSSFLFLDFLRIPRAYGLVFAVVSSGIVWGGIGAGRCARHGISYQGTLLGGILLGLAGSLILLALHLAGAIRVATAIPTLLCITTALGLITPTAGPRRAGAPAPGGRTARACWASCAWPGAPWPRPWSPCSPAAPPAPWPR